MLIFHLKPLKPNLSTIYGEDKHTISYEHSALKPPSTVCSQLSPFNTTAVLPLELDLVRGHVQGRNQLTAIWHRKRRKEKLWEYSHQGTKISHFWKRTRHLLKWFGNRYVTSPKKRGKVDGKHVFSSSTVWPAFGDGIGFSGIHTQWSTLWKVACAFDTNTSWCAYVPGSINSSYWKKGHPTFNRGSLYYVTLFLGLVTIPYYTWKQWEFLDRSTRENGRELRFAASQLLRFNEGKKLNFSDLGGRYHSVLPLFT